MLLHLSFTKDGTYLIENQKLTSSDMVNYLYRPYSKSFLSCRLRMALPKMIGMVGTNLLQKQEIKSQLVGDDLFVTQSHMLQKGIEQNSANSILNKSEPGRKPELKPLRPWLLHKKSNFTSMVSHRDLVKPRMYLLVTWFQEPPVVKLKPGLLLDLKEQQNITNYLGLGRS